MSEQRKWPHRTPYELAKWLWGNPIKKISHHWRMTGNDTSENWIEVETANGERRRLNVDGREIQFSATDHRGLIVLDRYVMDSLHKFRQWEAENEHDLAEFERLKTKLGL